MTTTDVALEDTYEMPADPGEVQLDDWRPVVLDPVRQRLVELGGARIAEALTEASPAQLPPLATSYGFFHTICVETDEALTIWFQPVGDVPAIRLVVVDPFADGWALTEELIVPTATRHLVVLAPLAAPEGAVPRADARLLAICTTPIEDLGIGADVLTPQPLGRLSMSGPLFDL